MLVERLELPASNRCGYRDRVGAEVMRDEGLGERAFESSPKRRA